MYPCARFLRRGELGEDPALLNLPRRMRRGVGCTAGWNLCLRDWSATEDAPRCWVYGGVEVSWGGRSLLILGAAEY